ncbi:MAG: DUF1800 domain-containing protein [Phycisphaeraceae bacterium]|nr:DUF1800 domain-containing protein [Phycisphaeraceae bacterium]MCB9847957.1 DUF1800 domain-containing protein [Phycisphaeraceae bacterium]
MSENQPTQSMRAIGPEAFTPAAARRLLWRAGFGGTPGQARTLSEWGPERAVDFLLEYDAIPYERDDDSSFSGSIVVPLSEQEQRQLARARQGGDEETVARFRARRQAAQREDRKQMASVQRWWLARMIESPRPMQEKMTLFWHGRLVSGYRAVENSYHMLGQNNLFREHALGSFAGLLHAIIRDPAMLEYLDNKRSRKNAPNENLARELMELFALGVGAYSERDIKEGARALTGYSYEGNGFVFNRNQHDGGSKTILGVRGPLDGDGFVDAILAQRACAEFLCWGLYRFFVADLPQDFKRTPGWAKAVIGKMASTLRRHKYELRPALRELFLSEHFHDPALGDEKIKSPVELVVGAVRSIGAPVRELGVLIDALDLMGQDLFNPPNVAGWAGGRAWINTSTLYARQNTLTYLLTGETPEGERRRARGGHPFDPRSLASGLGVPAKDTDLFASALLGHLLGEAAKPLRPQRERLVSGMLREAPGMDGIREAVGLITALPEYQLC